MAIESIKGRRILLRLILTSDPNKVATLYCAKDLLYLIMENNHRTTREAFADLISQRGWYKPLNIPEGTASATAKRFKDGLIVSIDKMEELLEKAGYSVVQEKLWSK